MTHTDRETKKADAIAAVAAAIDTLELENRQLDDWEKMQIASALNSVLRGAYLLALSHANLVMVSRNERSRVPVQLDPQIAEMDLARFRGVLAQAQTEPVRQFAFFGRWTD